MLNLFRCLCAMLVWLGMSLAVGIVGAFYGPGAVGIVAALFLSACGIFLHLVLWAFEREPHCSYAGLVFGAVTTITMLVFALLTSNATDQSDEYIVLILFGIFSVLSYFIYPVASAALNYSRK